MKKILIAFIMCSISSVSYADEIFDTTNMSPDEIIQLAEDVGGNQGRCVLNQTLEFMDFGVDVIIKIPEESHGVEFISDDDVHVICTRFTEDYYIEGELTHSIPYENIEGYK